MRVSNTDGQFVSIFISAFLLLTVALGLTHVAWSLTGAQPSAFLEFLNTPRFSILDIVTGLAGMLLLFVLITALRWAPRP